MENKFNKELVHVAKMLRKNMTKEEKHLWYDFLSTYPIKIVRQKVLGRYIADFYCAKAKLVIELDGSGHYSDAGRERDEERTHFLEGYDLEVLRISNLEIHKNFQGVCEHLDRKIRERLNARE